MLCNYHQPKRTQMPDTQRLRAISLPERFAFPCGTILEHLNGDNFKLTNYNGENLGYVKAEPVEYMDSLKSQYFASRLDDVPARLDQGVDRTPQAI